MTHQFHLPEAPASEPAHPARGDYYPAVLGGFGSVIMIFGTFMPWARVLTPFGSLEIVGVGTPDGGVALMVAGALLGLFALNAYWRKNWLRVAQLFVAAAALAAAAWKIVDATSVIDRAGAGLARASLGSGLVLIAFGALVTLFAAAMHLFVPAET